MPKHVLRNTTSPRQKLGKQGGNASRATRVSRQKQPVTRNRHVHVVRLLGNFALSQPNHRLLQGRHALRLPRLHHLQYPLNHQQDAMGHFLSFITLPIHRFKRIDLQLERPGNISRQETSRRYILTLKMHSFPATHCQPFLGLVNIHRILYPGTRASSPIISPALFFHRNFPTN